MNNICVIFPKCMGQTVSDISYCLWFSVVSGCFDSFWLRKIDNISILLSTLKKTNHALTKPAGTSFFVLQTFEGDYFSTLVVWKWTFSRLIVVALVWSDLYSLIISPDLVKKKIIIIRCPLLTQTDMFMHEKVFFTSKLMDCLALMVMKWYLII